jgi:hypothetical protein
VTASIGFGPLKGPDRVGGAAADVVKQPGETLEDGTIARPAPTSESLVIPGLSLTTGTDRDAHGQLRAWVRAQWSIPPQGEHETDPNGIGSYQISYSDRIAGWSAPANTEARDVTIRNLKIRSTIDVRVRARTNKGTFGAYATASILTKADNDPPPVPSAPIIEGTLRGAALRWDGMFAGNVAPPDDYQYVIGQMSLDPAFPPSATIECSERLYTAGTTAVYQLGTPPFTVHARFRSMDNSGNLSEWSAVTSGTGIRIIPDDVGQAAITRAALADGLRHRPWRGDLHRPGRPGGDHPQHRRRCHDGDQARGQLGDTREDRGRLHRLGQDGRPGHHQRQAGRQRGHGGQDRAERGGQPGPARRRGADLEDR